MISIEFNKQQTLIILYAVLSEHDHEKISFQTDSMDGLYTDVWVDERGWVMICYDSRHAHGLSTAIESGWTASYL